MLPGFASSFQARSAPHSFANSTSTRILKLANSPLYRSGRAIETAEADGHKSLVGIVVAADHTANHLQLAKADSYDLTTNLGWQVLAQGCGDGMKEKLESLAPAIMEESLKEAQEVVGKAASLAGLTLQARKRSVFLH